MNTLKITNIKEFITDIKNSVYTIYPRKKLICINGFKYYSLNDLKKLPLKYKLQLPNDIFETI